MSGFNKDRVLALLNEVELFTCEGRGPNGWVYFIMCADTHRCKIGFTKGDPQKRLKSLQTGCPGELSVVVRHPGTSETEARLHRKFAASKIRGEWFDLTDELRAYMISALWAMCEIAIRDGRRLEPWMQVGLEYSIQELGVLPESLGEALEMDPA